MIIPRPKYLKQLIAAKGNRMIKIITGIRRCGKSFLLFELFHNHLNNEGVRNDHIIELSLDDRLNLEYRNPDRLLEFVRAKIVDSEPYFLLLDEVQMVNDFVDVLNSLLHIRNLDTYVTGSNSRFLSKDVVTEFRGRGMDIHMYPLSFSEFYSAFGGSREAAWRDYYTYGGLPQILLLPEEQSKRSYLANLADTVYISDVIERHKIKNKPELGELFQILASSIGAPCNPTKLSNSFKSLKHTVISHKTIANYIDYLGDAFLIEKAMRYDIKGKKYINNLAKYYFTDCGIRNAVLNFRQLEPSHLMENIIFNELLYQGFTVDVGIVNLMTKSIDGASERKQFEVDFVANSSDQRYYIQSAYQIPDASKMSQETNSLRRIKDSFKRVVIVNDNLTPYYNDEGILFVGLLDFLLNPEIMKG